MSRKLRNTMLASLGFALGLCLTSTAEARESIQRIPVRKKSSPSKAPAPATRFKPQASQTRRASPPPPPVRVSPPASPPPPVYRYSETVGTPAPPIPSQTHPKPSQWSFRISPSAGFAAWEDSAQLVEISTGEAGEARSTRTGLEAGLDLGAVYAKQLELGADFRFLWTGGTAAGTAGSASYFATSAASYGATATAVVRWYPGAGRFSIGAHFGGFYRNAPWSAPEDPDLTLSDSERLPLVAFGELRWAVWLLSAHLKIGYSPRAASAIWMLGGGWDF